MSPTSGRPLPTHLVVRFFATLWPAPPRPDDEVFALGQMEPGEQELWWRMSRADRRHAIGVARRVIQTLDASAGRREASGPSEGDDARVPRPVVAAALLHDVGKVESGLGAVGRSIATVAALIGGRRRVGRAWSARGGWIGRAGRYLDHPSIGAAMLREAGSDPLTVQWAEEHHLAPERWEMPIRWSRALKDADND